MAFRHAPDYFYELSLLASYLKSGLIQQLAMLYFDPLLMILMI